MNARREEREEQQLVVVTEANESPGVFLSNLSMFEACCSHLGHLQKGYGARGEGGGGGDACHVA